MRLRGTRLVKGRIDAMRLIVLQKCSRHARNPSGDAIRASTTIKKNFMI